MNVPRSVVALSLGALLCAACTSTPSASPPPARSSPAAQSNPTSAGAPSARPAASPATANSPAPAAERPASVSSKFEALGELAVVKAGYEEAQKAFEAGDKQRALDLMNTAYLEHFGRIQPWMDQNLSPEYRQQVESVISSDLRGKLRDGGSDAEIRAQFPIAFERLTEAQGRVAALP
jgi:hypothetical protein